MDDIDEGYRGAYTIVRRPCREELRRRGYWFWGSRRFVAVFLSFTRLVFYPFEDDEKSTCDM